MNSQCLYKETELYIIYVVVRECVCACMYEIRSSTIWVRFSSCDGLLLFCLLGSTHSFYLILLQFWFLNETTKVPPLHQFEVTVRFMYITVITRMVWVCTLKCFLSPILLLANHLHLLHCITNQRLRAGFCHSNLLKKQTHVVLVKLQQIHNALCALFQSRLDLKYTYLTIQSTKQ